ncbi:MAG: Uma2 family endonuclease [Gemmatimonadales bacterium]
MPLAAPRYTIADLERFPDDGNRYELLDGALLVTPAPGPQHQVALGRLTMALAGYLAPSGLAVITTPGVIQLAEATQLEPDLLVVPARFADSADWRGMGDWWLAVEVSGAASRIYDRDFKTEAYLRLGVREVWRIDLPERILYRSRGATIRHAPETGRLTWHPPELDQPLFLDLGPILRPTSE